MSNLERKIADARSSMGGAWTTEHLRDVEQRLGRRIRHRRRVQRTAAVGAVVLLVAGVVAYSGWRARNGQGAAAITLADGSTASPLDPTTDLAVTESAPQQVTLELRRGAARFQVQPNRDRLFRVVAGGVTVEVVGTRFDVARQSDGHVRVSVTVGRVHVLTPAGTRELGAGEQAVFVSVEAPVLPAPQAVQEESPPPPAPERKEPDSALNTRVERHAQGDVGKLWNKVDWARSSRQPSAAVAPLSRIVREFPKDSSAPLAAFTLGRILFDDLHRPREAARAFADVARLDPASDLTQDALAREVDAWVEAGERERAVRGAKRYLEQHPHGPRAAAMRRVAEQE